jgi:hypothetical protein
MDLPVILLTSYYQDGNIRRQTEIDACLRRNLENTYFHKIVVVVEGKFPDETLLINAKVPLEFIQVEGRLTYQDFFTIAASFPSPSSVILANSDIFFDESLALLAHYPLEGRFLALSRWDVHENQKSSSCFLRPDSQDAWIFQSPLPPMAADFMLGQAGCDNRIAWEAGKAGLEVLNPSLSIRAHHLHTSGVRNYDSNRKVSGPYLLVAPHHLESDTVRRLALKMDGSDDPAAIRQDFEQLIADLPSQLLCPLALFEQTDATSKPQLRHSLSVVIPVNPNNRQWLACTIASLDQVWDELVIVGDASPVAEARQVSSEEWLLAVRTDWVLLLQPGELVDQKVVIWLQQLRNHTFCDKIQTDNLWFQKQWISPWNLEAILSSEPHNNNWQGGRFLLSSTTF